MEIVFSNIKSIGLLLEAAKFYVTGRPRLTSFSHPPLSRQVYDVICNLNTDQSFSTRVAISVAKGFVDAESLRLVI